MKDALVVSLLSLVPRNHGARAMGWLARTGASRAFTRAFVAIYGVDLGEAEVPPGGFRNLESLFTRTLRAGARPLATADLVSPVDGRLAAWGKAGPNGLQIAPGKFVNLAELHGEPVSGAWDAAVLYLSPRDYHRVHSPIGATVSRFVYRPGTLWPVFPAAVSRIDGLFAANERVALHLDSTDGPMVCTLVGAFGVGRITWLGGGGLESNAGVGPAAGRVDVAVAAGGELGIFHLGSTVVLAWPSGRYRPLVNVGEPVRMGSALGVRA